MLTRLLKFTGLVLTLAGSLAAAPLGAAFTYQGRLQQNGAPMNGTVDLRFSLWNAVSGSTGQIGLTIDLNDVAVNNGLFTVQVNDAGQFGPNAFNGESRWINIAVRAGTSTDSFTALVPRQAVTVAPYAQHAMGPWVTSGTTLVYTGGFVGIGIATPTVPLDVQGPVQIVNTGDQADALWLGIERSWVFRQQGTGAGTALKLESVGGGGNKHFLIQTTGDVRIGGAPANRLTVESDGDVGIGTTTPAAKLDVVGNVMANGDIRLGGGGQYYAPAAEENLRIIRGSIDNDSFEPPRHDAGAGFQVAHTGTGVYRFDIIQPFGGLPSVTVTPQYTGGSAIHVLQTVQVQATSFKVLAYNRSDGSPVNARFDFIAIGPR